jgi:hypothetical protein
MTAANRSQINRLTKEIADLRKADAREAEREADLLTKLNRASEAAGRSKAPSTVQAKLREVERASKDRAAVQKKRGDIAGKIADKLKNLRSFEGKQASDDEKARKKAAEAQKKLIREREAHDRRLSSELRNLTRAATEAAPPTAVQEEHDFFISHASEDKDGFVRELAGSLRAEGAKVWYDEFSLRVGDSLRRSIDRGLANSRFGVVILSEAFFRKEWPNRELDGLVALETQSESRILPIWHKVSKDEVARYSPTLADKVALNTSLKSIAEITSALMEFLSERRRYPGCC